MVSYRRAKFPIDEITGAPYYERAWSPSPAFFETDDDRLCEVLVVKASGIRGLWHVALRVTDLARSQAFYSRLFGMSPVWQPDPDNLYMSSGMDNLALHQIPSADLAKYRNQEQQFLDHIGFIVDEPMTVDHLFELATQDGSRIIHRPKQHRDGSYSCYLADPDGNTVQILYEPTLSRLRPEVSR
jgi:catechol 2,3-dioxygenase-like lactoylglutathione lyase family enzyme